MEKINLFCRKIEQTKTGAGFEKSAPVFDHEIAAAPPLAVTIYGKIFKISQDCDISKMKNQRPVTFL